MGCNVRKDNRRNKKSSGPGIERGNGESSLTWAEHWTDLKKFAFGWMGLSPHEFYEMDNEDFFLMMRGFKDMLIDQKRDLRRAVYLIVSTQVKDMPSAMRIWPIEKDEELNGEIKKQQEISQQQHNQNFTKLVSMFKKPQENWPSN